MGKEDSWFRCERQFFVNAHAKELKIKESHLNKILEKYNKFLNDHVLKESPYDAECLRLTILRARGEE